MKRTPKELLVRVLILMAGLVIAHLGVTLFLLADLGADPFNVFVQGVFRTLEKAFTHPLLTHGNVHVVISLIIIAVLLFVDRSYVKIGTLLCMIFGGPIIDGFTWLLTPVYAAVTALWFRVITLALGCVILAFGMSIVIKSDAGTGPNDLVAVVISDKIGKKFSIIRVIVDFSFVLVGFLLGGKFGAGTIICAFLVGPTAGFFLPRVEKTVGRIIGKI